MLVTRLPVDFCLAFPLNWWLLYGYPMVTRGYSLCFQDFDNFQPFYWPFLGVRKLKPVLIQQKGSFSCSKISSILSLILTPWQKILGTILDKIHWNFLLEYYFILAHQPPSLNVANKFMVLLGPCCYFPTLRRCWGGELFNLSKSSKIYVHDCPKILRMGT